MKVSCGWTEKWITAANRLICLRRLMCAQCTVMHVLSGCCSQYPFFVPLSAAGLATSAQGTRGVGEKAPVALTSHWAQAVLAASEERMLTKLSVIIGNDLHPSPWHAVSPAEDPRPLARFTELCQSAHQAPGFASYQLTLRHLLPR